MMSILGANGRPAGDRGVDSLSGAVAPDRGRPEEFDPLMHWSSMAADPPLPGFDAAIRQVRDALRLWLTRVGLLPCGEGTERPTPDR